MKLSFFCVFMGMLWCCACGSDESLAPTESEPLPNPLPTEAGFLEPPVLPLGAQTSGRLFYAFQSAKYPDDAPLLVFFNGGPGVATTGIGVGHIVDGHLTPVAPVHSAADHEVIQGLQRTAVSFPSREWPCARPRRPSRNARFLWVCSSNTQPTTLEATRVPLRQIC